MLANALLFSNGALPVAHRQINARRKSTTSIEDLSPRDETARLPPMLLQQPDVRHRHAAVHRLAHVVDGEQGDLHGGQGFHLS